VESLRGLPGGLEHNQEIGRKVPFEAAGSGAQSAKVVNVASCELSGGSFGPNFPFEKCAIHTELTTTGRDAYLQPIPGSLIRALSCIRLIPILLLRLKIDDSRRTGGFK
jgi:hypothetical protein